MPESTNKDGLIPGQLVDEATVKRVEQARKNRKSEPVKRAKQKAEQPES